MPQVQPLFPRLLALPICLGLGVAAAGCGASGGDGGDGRSVEIEMRAIPLGGSGDLVAPDQGGSDLQIDSALVHVRDIELYLPDDADCDDLEDDGFFACDDDEGDDKIVIEGPFEVDLVAGEVAADVALPVGSYRRVDVRVDDVNDVTFAASGRLDMGSTEAEVEVVLDFNEDIRFEGDIDLGPADSVHTLLLALDVSEWMSGVALRECVEREDFEDGPVVVGEDNSGSGSCSDLENGIRENIEASGDLLFE